MFDLGAISEGLSGIFQPKAFALMMFGMAVSSLFAAVPGIGSLLFLSMMIPYAMTLTPYECIALLLGIATVSNTANTFSSVLIAVPGSAGSQATIVDGYPMAQKGEANRAFGAAFAASGLGAIFGAFVFLCSLPLMRPMVLAVGSPELMMLVVWGLCAVALLGGRSPLKGLLAAVIGLAIATIGADGRSGTERFVFDELYLVEGVPIIIMALGMFAIPELIALAARGTSVSTLPPLGGGLKQGIRDVFTNWWLVIRCSTIGVWVGAMPGLGSSVADWFAYAHTVQSSKDKENFGKGDVRGVIGPESSNNAKEGGALIPTTLFGIPGSTSFALILYAFIAVGIQPGQSIITTQLPYLYAMIAVLVIANLMATTLAISASNLFAKATLVHPRIIFSMVIALCFVGAFSMNYSVKDLLALLIISTIGYFMKRYGWPRPPLLLAVVLGPQFETYLWLTTDRYGLDWMTRTGVLVVLGLIIVTIFVPTGMRIYRRWRDKIKDEALRPRFGDAVLLIGVMALLAFGAEVASEWSARASLSIFVIAGVGFALAIPQLGLNILAYMRTTPDTPLDGEAQDLSQEIQAWGWIYIFFFSALIFGFHASFAVFPVVYVLAKGGSWKQAIGCGVAAMAFLLVLFEFLIRIVWPDPLILELYWYLFDG